MIIAAYAGCGKTTLAANTDKCIEVASMPYARILPFVEEENTGKFEYEKASIYHVNNPIFPYNMIAEILEAEKRFKYVIIPSVRSVIEILQREYARTVILCYPEDGLENEYRERYIKRGNTDEFCQVFVDRMQEFLDGLKSNEDACHVVLKSGEYLSDKFEEIEEICKDIPITEVEQEKTDKLNQYIQEKKSSVWLEVHCIEDTVFYRVEDIDDKEEREFIYDLAKRLYVSDFSKVFSYDFDVTDVERRMGSPFKVVDKTELTDLLKKHEEKIKELFG